MLNIGEFARLGQVSPRMLRHYDETGLLNPTFQRLVPEVLEHLEHAGAQPGIMIAWYEEQADDGTVVVHAGFDIAADSDRFRTAIPIDFVQRFRRFSYRAEEAASPRVS